MILGLDISTSCTGWCLLDTDGLFVDAGYIPLAKYKDMFSKAQHVENEIKSIASKKKIISVAIEQNLQSFRSGFSSAQTLSSLARFNGVVSFICFKEMKIKPNFINVNSARKLVGMKIQREKICGVSTKEQVLQWAIQDLDKSKYPWPKKTLKSGPRKGITIQDPACYDIADAYVIAKSAYIEQFSDI